MVSSATRVLRRSVRMQSHLGKSGCGQPGPPRPSKLCKHRRSTCCCDYGLIGHWNEQSHSISRKRMAKLNDFERNIFLAIAFAQLSRLDAGWTRRGSKSSSLHFNHKEVCHCSVWEKSGLRVPRYAWKYSRLVSFFDRQSGMKLKTILIRCSWIILTVSPHIHTQIGLFAE